MELGSIFKPENVLFLTSNEKQVAIKEMISHLESQKKINSTPRYYAQVIHRESLENTGIGNGFAIPHARTDSVNELNFVFGISSEGINYSSYDNKNVKYLLLCIFPTSMSTEYLFLVSMIAKIFSVKKNRDELDGAKSSEDVYSILKKHSENYYDNIDSNKPVQMDHSANLAGVPTSDLELLIRLDRLNRLYDETKSPEIHSKIESLCGLIDKRSFAYYEKMRSKCSEPFAIVEKNTCSGCHMNIPPIEINEIMERNKISICSYCGRFLIIL